MFLLALVAVVVSRAGAPATSQHLTAKAARFRAYVYRTHPCLAQIVDREDPTWSPTVNYGGSHGNVEESYGLGQADPGTKMEPFGRAWRWSRWVQLRWALSYAGRYGGECGSWSFWQAHSWW